MLPTNADNVAVWQVSQRYFLTGSPKVQSHATVSSVFLEDRHLPFQNNGVSARVNLVSKRVYYIRDRFMGTYPHVKSLNNSFTRFEMVMLPSMASSQILASSASSS